MHPEGFHNDVNGLQYWNGRYHMFYLGRTPIPDTPDRPENDDWIGRVWQHISSADLIHWIHHPAALEAPPDGTTNRGPQSGSAIANAPVPTLIYHWGEQGTYIATCEDDDLINWKPLTGNPVIPIPENDAEYVVFDPCAWYDKNNLTYYALIGNKNKRQGFEGDCTSLFKSSNLTEWEYVGPFYKSSRDWTGEEEDAACPDFFPLGGKYILLMHGHQPYTNCHYYIGTYENEKFYPEKHGRMNWPGGQLGGPETFLDEKGRRIFFGWIPEAQGRDWKKYGWASTISLPRILTLTKDDILEINPAEELKSLRNNYRHKESIHVNSDTEITLEDIRGDTMEIIAEIESLGAKEYGIKVRCSPNGDEETSILYLPFYEVIKVGLEKSTLDNTIQYTVGTGESIKVLSSQEAPLHLLPGENLKLRIFMDRSVLEIFANGRQCLTQRIYPTRVDRIGIKLFSKRGDVLVRSFDAWDMLATSC
jgi:sucrose-6-phosphate hydrolase SacC (GH32 family)